MQPFHLRINRCSTYTAGYEQDLLLLQLLPDLSCTSSDGLSKRSYKITESITGLEVCKSSL